MRPRTMIIGIHFFMVTSMGWSAINIRTYTRKRRDIPRGVILSPMKKSSQLVVTFGGPD